jgi:hypothetical protein
MNKLPVMKHHYGKLPARHDARTMMYTDYLTKTYSLTTVPSSQHWEKKLPANWGSMGNNTIGDCTVAAAGHLIMNWTGNSSKKEKIIPEKEIINVYAAVSGYNPQTKKHDNGANLLDVLNYWRKSGIGQDKVTAYVSLELKNPMQLKEAVYLFGGAYIGLVLPDSATVGQKIWAVPPGGPHGIGRPNPSSGHCVPIVGYDERYLYIVTWGKIKMMTWSFYDTYCDEAYVLLSPDWFNDKRNSPLGFDMNTLQKDLKEIVKPVKLHTSGAFSGVPIADAFAAAALKESPVKVKLPNIPWPVGFQPQPATLKKYSQGAKINGKIGEPVDVLLLAYTDGETEALLEVFTGNGSWSASAKANAYKYTHNFSSIKSKIIQGQTNATKAGIMGYIIPFTIGDKKVLVFKSELHPKNNGKYLPFVPVIQQLIEDVDPKVVLTTGTSGAIGPKINCGDVVITNVARLHCQHNYVGYGDIALITQNNTELKNESPLTISNKYIDYANLHLLPLSGAGLSTCHSRFAGDPNYKFLKNNVSPSIYQHVPGVQPMDILSADYLTVDDNGNLEQLQSLGILNDTDDGFAVYAIHKMSGKTPTWLSVRNASEPQITDPSFPSGTTMAQKEKQVKSLAGAVYGVYQFCTTLNSAFACWAIIAGM